MTLRPDSLDDHDHFTCIVVVRRRPENPTAKTTHTFTRSSAAHTKRQIAFFIIPF